MERKFLGNLFLFGFKTNPFCRTNSQKARHSPVKLSSVLMHYGKAVEVGERKSIVAWQMLPAGDCGDTLSVVMELNHMLKASSQSSGVSSADESSLLGSDVSLSQWVGVDRLDTVGQCNMLDSRNRPSDVKCSQTSGKVSVLSWDGSTLDFEECNMLPSSVRTDGGCTRATEGIGGDEGDMSIICDCSKTRQFNRTSSVGQTRTVCDEDKSMDYSSLLICSGDLRLFDQRHVSPPHESQPSNDTVTHLYQEESPPVTDEAPDVTREKCASKTSPQCTANDSKNVTDVSRETTGRSYNEMPESEDLDAFLRLLPADASLSEHQLCGLAAASVDGNLPPPDHSNAACPTSHAHIAVGDSTSCDNDPFVESAGVDKNKLNMIHALFTDAHEDDTDSSNIISPSQQCLPQTDRGKPFSATASEELLSLPDIGSCSFNCSSDLFDTSGDSPSGDSPSGDTPSGDSPPGDSPSGDSPCGESPSGDSPCGDSPCGDSPPGDSFTSSRLSSQASCISSTQDSGSTPPAKSGAVIVNQRVSLLRSEARSVHFARRLSSVQSVDVIDQRMTSTPLGDVTHVRRRSCLKTAALVRSCGHVTSCDDSYDGSQELFSPCGLSMNPSTGVCGSLYPHPWGMYQVTKQTDSPLITADVSTRQLGTKRNDVDQSVTKIGTHLMAIHDTCDSPDLFSDSSSQPLSASSLEVNNPCKDTGGDVPTQGGCKNQSGVTRNILGDVINTDFNVIETDRSTSEQFNLYSQDLFSQSIEATDLLLCRKLF